MNLLYLPFCTVACIITSYLLVRSLSRDATHHTRILSSISAAVVFAFDIWSLHVVSVFHMLPGTHGPVGTRNISLALAVSGTGALLVFLVLTYRPRFRFPDILAALVIGVSICAPSYFGFAAFGRFGLSGSSYLTASLALICATFFAFIFVRTLRNGSIWRQTLGAAFWLTCAVLSSYAIEHFLARDILGTNMSGSAYDSAALYFLALASMSMSFAILGYSLITAFFEQKHNHLTQKEIQRFQKLAEVTTECLLILDADIVVETNNVLASIIGLPPGSLKGRSLLAFINPLSQTTLASALLQVNDDMKLFELDVLLQNGEALTLSCTLSAVEYDRRPLHVLAMRDFSHQKAHASHIRHLAMHDSLTTLPNRAFFHERMDAALLEASLANSEFAVFYLDLDKFKSINDNLGHEAGDDLLVQVAHRLKDHISPHDTVARLGGDEFVLIHRMAGNRDDVTQYASSLIESLNHPYKLSEQTVTAAASIGIALHPEHGTETKTLLRHADIALFRAKADGRGSFVMFSQDLREENKRRERFKTAIAQGIRDQAFCLQWVPVLTPELTDFEGYEATLCLQHPEDGIVPLTDFMELAEDFGFAEQLISVLFRDACHEATGWPAHVGLSLSLCLEQLTRLDLDHILKTALDRSGLAPQRLRISLYESQRRARHTKAIETVMSLEEAYGVRFSFDDIGLARDRRKNGALEDRHTCLPAPA